MGQQQSSTFTLLMPSCIPARPPRRVSACDSSTSTAPSRALLPAASLQPPQQTRGFIHRHLTDAAQTPNTAEAVRADTALPGQRLLRGGAGGQLSTRQSLRAARSHIQRRAGGSAPCAGRRAAAAMGPFGPVSSSSAFPLLEEGIRAPQTRSSGSHRLREATRSQAKGAHGNTGRLRERSPAQRPSGREEPADKARPESRTERCGPEGGGARRGPSTALGPTPPNGAPRLAPRASPPRRPARPGSRRRQRAPHRPPSPAARGRRLSSAAPQGRPRRKPGGARGMPGAVVRQARRPRLRQREGLGPAPSG